MAISRRTRSLSPVDSNNSSAHTSLPFLCPETMGIKTPSKIDDVSSSTYVCSRYVQTWPERSVHVLSADGYCDRTSYRSTLSAGKQSRQI
eukprot:CAMPEP_0178565612 /NCGR_PEP_ID=MMETSP0697-20121206/14272_1 /TAXON_ID=265572 /ORGANISM="Extubocellulus spinifer, Strain CCMP396" /LENGTH=89 /DNA_ID=CAMNT_0020199265 /DNA_START=12 /DNA_END=281 /DNA_ORIENTATION=-